MPAEEGDHVRIGLKDVYVMVQALERSIADSLGNLNLTMVAIKAHMEQVDARNAAADQIHTEHGQRISHLESVMQQVQPVSSHREFEDRIGRLEKAQVGEDAVRGYRVRSRAALIAALAAAAAAVGALGSVIFHVHG